MKRTSTLTKPYGSQCLCASSKHTVENKYNMVSKDIFIDYILYESEIGEH